MDVTLKIFTQQVFMQSPTYFRAMKGDFCTQTQEPPYVDMTADIEVNRDFVEVGLKDNPRDVDTIHFKVSNRMWKDPAAEGQEDEYFELHFDLFPWEVEYLIRHLGSIVAEIRKEESNRSSG